MSSGFPPALRGCRISLRTVDDGEYCGTVVKADATRRRITLRSVAKQRRDRSPEPLLGVQDFCGDDVVSFTVLDTPDPDQAPSGLSSGGSSAPGLPKRVNKSVSSAGDKMLMSRRPPENDHQLSDLLDSSLLLSEMSLRDGDAGHPDGEESSDVQKPVRVRTPDPLLPRPANYVMIETCDADLHDMVAYLSKQSYVGVSAEGVLLGRAGDLSLLSLASGEMAFVVDVVACGGRPALELLKPLLESSSVQKVVHDCRGLSDLLHHQFAVQLENVFDTQAAEVYIYHQHHGVLPAYVSNVAHTLVSRLNLLPRQVFFPRCRVERMREDQQVWLRRPLSDYLLEGATRNLLFLRELRYVQMETMFSRYVQCVDIYLDTVRDGDAEDAAAAPFEQHRLPVRVQRVLDAPSRPVRAEADCRTPGTVNNVVAGLDRGFQFTRNVWRSGASGVVGPVKAGVAAASNPTGQSRSITPLMANK